MWYIRKLHSALRWETLNSLSDYRSGQSGQFLVEGLWWLCEGKGGFLGEVSLPAPQCFQRSVLASCGHAGREASIPKWKCLTWEFCSGTPGSVLSSHHLRKVSISQECIAELMGWAGFEVLAEPLTLCPVSSHTTEVAGRLWHPESSSIWHL